MFGGQSEGGACRKYIRMCRNDIIEIRNAIHLGELYYKMQTTFDAAQLLEECQRLCKERVAAAVRMPPYVRGPLAPLPADLVAFVGDQQLPAFPVLPAREVLRTMRMALRTRWVCLSHYKGAPKDSVKCTAELDNYGNVLLQFDDGAAPMYVVRSVAAYHPALVAAALQAGLGRGWMRLGEELGPVACSVCGKKSDGQRAGFPGCGVNCLAPSMLVGTNGGSDAKKMGLLAAAVARHTNEVLQDAEPQLRTNLCTCIDRGRGLTPAPVYEQFGAPISQ